MRSEAENNLVLGVARRIRDDKASAAEAYYWVTVEHDDRVVGCAFRTPPHQVGLSRMPLEAIPLLAEDVREFCGQVPGVGGPREEAEQFASSWTKSGDATWSMRMHQRIHVLTALSYRPDAANGALRRASAADGALVQRWMSSFVDETAIPHPANELVARLLDSGRIYLWEDNGPRCMVAAARDTPNGSCINAVYTPPALRRRGYATAAVATLSEMLLAGGKAFCCLYTDAANPTSNSIYRRIGYQAVREDVDIAFVYGPPSNAAPQHPDRSTR